MGGRRGESRAKAENQKGGLGFWCRQRCKESVRRTNLRGEKDAKGSGRGARASGLSFYKIPLLPGHGANVQRKWDEGEEKGAADAQVRGKGAGATEEDRATTLLSGEKTVRITGQSWRSTINKEKRERKKKTDCRMEKSHLLNAGEDALRPPVRDPREVFKLH